MSNGSSATLRERQVSATREQIVDVAWQLLIDHPQEPFSHEAIAKRAGMGVRTVYRHFPHRTDLLQALWERVRDESGTRFPSTEDEIVPLVRDTFEHFNEHESLVRSSLAFSASAELRGQGSLQGRPAFRQSLGDLLANLPAASQRRVLAVCLGIWSAPFWQLLRDRGELSGKEAQEAGAWAMEAVLNAARAEASACVTRNSSGKERKKR
jgi:AcrR family transcriptional regulator